MPQRRQPSSDTPFIQFLLNVIQIRVPPLRERVEDIPLLVDQILLRLAPERSEASGGMSAGVSREATEMLLRYPWPGNIRELQNVVEAALVVAADRIIGVGALSERIIDHALAEPEGAALGEARPHEQVMVEMALNRFRGDKAKAARYIGWTTDAALKTFVKVPPSGRKRPLDATEKTPSRAGSEEFRVGERGWRAVG